MTELRKFVAEELSLSVDPRATRVAEAIAARHGSASWAVLFYGSCLRQKQLDGLVLDFYLIVSDYRLAYRKRWLAAANRLIPPNVFYIEHDAVRAKYAVLSEADFAHECSPDAWTVSTAARFAQPARLVWSADQRAVDRIVDVVSGAAPALLGWTLSVLPPQAAAVDIWKRAFELTFAAELRAEGADRSSAIVDADVNRYERFWRAMGVVPNSCGDDGRRWWRMKQRHGKLYSVARLAKAAFTFDGGAEYIAWKISRHAGTEIHLKPWQRRHPLLAGISLLPRLLRSGAVR